MMGNGSACGRRQIISHANKIIRECSNQICHLEGFNEDGLGWDNPQILTFSMYDRIINGCRKILDQDQEVVVR